LILKLCARCLSPGWNSGLAPLQGTRHRTEEFSVFRRTANGDANGLRKTHPAKRAHDDSFEEEFIAERFCRRADGDEEKVGFARNGRKAEFPQFVVETLALLTIHFDGTPNVFGVVESGQRGRLTHICHIEGSAELVHFGDKRGMADAISDAQSGESVHLRECAKREDVVVLAEKFERVGKIGTGSVLAVGLVEDDQDVTRDLCEEGVEFGGSERGPGRIVRVGDVDDSGLRRNRCGDGVEVEGKVWMSVAPLARMAIAKSVKEPSLVTPSRPGRSRTREARSMISLEPRPTKTSSKRTPNRSARTCRRCLLPPSGYQLASPRA